MRILFIKIIFIFFIPLLTYASGVNSASQLELNENEQKWIKYHPVVKFTGDPNWLPYEAFDERGNYIGIVAEHLKIIEKKLGLTFKKIPTTSWTESTEKAKQGLVDILSETDDSDLKSHLNFTIPYVSNPIVISMRNTENYVESINNIKDKKIALIKDYGYAAKIRRKYSNIDFVTVDDIQDGLISVSTGKVDALLCTLALCSYTIAELGLNNVKITGKTEFDTKLALGVQKNLPELLSILNKAIINISREQQQVILDSWIKNKFPIKTDYALVYQVIGIAVLLLLIFIIWIRRLFKEINLRIKTEKELKDAEESSRFSHQRLLLYREYTPLSVIEWNTDFEFLDWNPAAERIFGYTKEEVIGHHITERILPESARPHVDKVWEDLLANKGGTYSLNENITKDGRTILCEWHNTPLVDDEGKVIGVTSLTEDITERTKNEDNIRQTLKMNAMGKLTGGIAHDFNNMLGVILGFAELLKDQMISNNESNVEFCDEILNAGDRAKKLTLKLLDFSRKEPSSEEICDINEILHGMRHMLEKTLTHQIKLEFILEDELWPVMIDKARMEDAILNLCINSMQAMPEGGKLILTTKKIHKKEEVTNERALLLDDHVLFSVEDNGVGMDHDTQQKIYEPFFTTKGTGGTGLGMSQVYGFVQQSKGEIKIDSALDQGTRVTFHFPRVTTDENINKEDEVNYSTEFLFGNENILVVDDEIGLLELMKEILTKAGYTVFRANSADEALKVLETQPIDLMLSDVIMPGMNGYELATKVEALYPNINIQMISGYADEIKLQNNSALHENRLHKPVSSSVLLERIRKLLDEK